MPLHFNILIVQTMLDYYGASEKCGEFQKWDGDYSLGEKEILKWSNSPAY